jgi:NAD(P)H-hydrate epimerase
MDPIVTPTEMAAIDAAAPESVAVLIERAGHAVANSALTMLGGGYGRRIAVFAGTGNNGADGRAAASILERRGARCDVLTPLQTPRHAPDLVIDGCVGTGLRRPFTAPSIDAPMVLAIDIPSGIDGLTGEVLGDAFRADRTVTFAARKPGLLLGAGPEHAGVVEVADIGLDVGRPSMQLITDRDLARWPQRTRSAHKWQSAVWVIGGRPGMPGALSLAAEAAARSGAGYVTISTPGDRAVGHREAVSVAIPERGWGEIVGQRSSRHGSFVIGPGLDPSTDPADLAALLARDVPAVLDAGAIDLVAELPGMVAGKPVILTPHDGEFERLTGNRPGLDRVESVRRAAGELGATVLLKGPTTIVANPDGEVRLITSGDARLATAGTGDVLAGAIGAALACGLDPLTAAALAAHLHGVAAGRTRRPVILASDLLPHLAAGLAPRPST